ncbi:MAG: GerMN domain-containing protein, partial [Lachnospiraceae bacterium]|nr:GerMN domain-containing protein [Lachnospiraceae bacterium]
MNKKRYYILLLIVVLFAAACGSRGGMDRSRMLKVYYINNSETSVEMHEHEMTAEDAEGQLAELLEQLGTMPPKLEYKAPLQMGFTLLSAYIDGEKLYLDVSEEYRGLNATTEILVRAALVRTMSQVEGIKYVAITVEGGQLHDSLGNVVGLMSAEQFIDNAGNEINAYDKERLRQNI